MNKDPDIVPEEAPVIIFDIKSDVCMANSCKDTKHISHISRRVYFVKNCGKCKIRKIDWCEGGLQLTEIATKNVGENYLNIRMKYIVVRIEKWYRTLVQEGLQDTG